MKPGATAAQATKWLLINSPLSRGTITTQPDIRNEECFIPAASGDQQMAPRTARLMLKTSFQRIFQPFPGLRKSDMKTEGQKRKNKKETLSRTDRQCGRTPALWSSAHAAGLLMSAQIEAGIIISV